MLFGELLLWWSKLKSVFNFSMVRITKPKELVKQENAFCLSETTALASCEVCFGSALPREEEWLIHGVQ